jgi:hypothetical protein
MKEQVLGLSLLGTQEGQRIKEGQSRERPAPPSFPRHGARVAPQRCPILRAGSGQVSTERLNQITDCFLVDKNKSIYQKGDRCAKSP